MKDIKDLFVSYEISLALKEKGFNPGFYMLVFDSMNNNAQEFTTHAHVVDDKFNERYVICPLYQQVTDWFREKHNIDLWVQPYVTTNEENNLYMPDESYSYFLFKDGVWVKDRVDFLEPNEALVSGITEALTLIYT